MAIVVAAEGLLSSQHGGSGDIYTQPVLADLDSGLVFGPASHDAAISANEADLALARQRLARAPDEWLRQESFAAAVMRRFSLTHDYADLESASDILDDASRTAPAGSGPWLRMAGAAMMRHDLTAAERALSGADAMAVAPLPADRAEIAAIRGDIAFYRGDMDRALSFYSEAQSTSADVDQSYRLAVVAKAQGRFDKARSLFGSAAQASGSTPQARAGIALQIGKTYAAQGRHGEAALWYREAEKLFPGSPLGAALNAEALALAGDSAGAIAELERAVATHRWPEMMDALAMIHRSRGEREQSLRWAHAARQVWSERLAQAPLAARAHAAEHELAFGDPKLALQLARANLASRPYGEGRILMANALVANGRPTEAIGQLAMAEREGWRSAPMFALLAEAAAMTGDTDLADEAAERAKDMNRRIFDAEFRLAWFGHG